MDKFFQDRFINSLSSTIRPLRIISISIIGKENIQIVSKLKKEKIGNRYEEIDFSNINKADSTDLIICTELFDQTDNPRKVLKELSAKSKKYVLVVAPFWNSRSLSKLAKTRGLKLIDLKFPLPWAMVLVKKV